MAGDILHEGFIDQLIVENEPSSARVSGWISGHTKCLPPVWPHPIWSPFRRATRLVSSSRHSYKNNGRTYPPVSFRRGVSINDSNQRPKGYTRFVTPNSSLQGVHQTFFDALRRSQGIFSHRELQVPLTHVVLSVRRVSVPSCE